MVIDQGMLQEKETLGWNPEDRRVQSFFWEESSRTWEQFPGDYQAVVSEAYSTAVSVGRKTERTQGRKQVAFSVHLFLFLSQSPILISTLSL